MTTLEKIDEQIVELWKVRDNNEGNKSLKIIVNACVVELEKIKPIIEQLEKEKVELRKLLDDIIDAQFNPQASLASLNSEIRYARSILNKQELKE